MLLKTETLYIFRILGQINMSECDTSFFDKKKVLQWKKVTPHVFWSTYFLWIILDHIGQVCSVKLMNNSTAWKMTTLGLTLHLISTSTYFMRNPNIFSFCFYLFCHPMRHVRNRFLFAARFRDFEKNVGKWRG